jgi:GNAT superfamily N-acetyltransferase
MRKFCVYSVIDHDMFEKLKLQATDSGLYVWKLFVQMAKEQFVKQLHNVFFGLYIDDEYGLILGGISFVTFDESVRIDLMCVFDCHKGHGKAMLAEFEKYTIECGYKQCIAIATEKSKGFFVKHGYTGKQVMQKNFIPIVKETEKI